MGKQEFQSLPPKAFMESLAGGNDITPEAKGVVIIFVKGQTCHIKKIYLLFSGSNPLPDQRCFGSWKLQLRHEQRLKVMSWHGCGLLKHRLALPQYGN